MTMQELQTINQNRRQGETFNAAKNRLRNERKISQTPQHLLMPPKEEEPDWVKNDDAEEGFSSEDLIVPRYKIVQPSSRIDGAKEGVFYNTLTHEERPKLENIVFLTRQNGRVLFPSGDFSGTRECFSYDGVVPERDAVLKESGEEPKSEYCVIKTNGQKKTICPFAIWPDGPQENGSRSPKCKEAITLLCVDELLNPFFLIFHGMGIPVVKSLLGAIYLQKRQAMLQKKELHLRSFSITIALKLQINARGKFYTPVFEKVEEITDMLHIQALNTCFKSLSTKRCSETIQAEAEARSSEVIEAELVESNQQEENESTEAKRP